MYKGCKVANQLKAPFVLPELPFSKEALEPHMSKETFDYHHGKHHKAYVDKLNELIKGTELENLSLEQIIEDSFGKEDKIAIFNNAAQVWNHTFFWHCMKADGGGVPGQDLLELINRDFGSFNKFKEDFKNMGVSQFGSGWVWLVQDNEGKLKLMKTSNADLPFVHGFKAIITADVWEHAYYIDYRNVRPNYLEVFLNDLVNWEFATNALKGNMC